MNEITIEKMKKEDISNVAKVFMQVFNQTGENWTYDMAQKRVEADMFDDCHFVARTDNKIIGFILGISLVFEQGNSLFIDAITVLPEFQNKGVGTLLWKRMERYAKENNFNAIRLQTNPKWESFNWYKEMGYTESGWIEVFKKLG